MMLAFAEVRRARARFISIIGALALITFPATDPCRALRRFVLRIDRCVPLVQQRERVRIQQRCGGFADSVARSGG